MIFELNSQSPQLSGSVDNVDKLLNKRAFVYKVSGVRGSRCLSGDVGSFYAAALFSSY